MLPIFLLPVYGGKLAGIVYFINFYFFMTLKFRNQISVILENILNNGMYKHFSLLIIKFYST